MKQTQKQKDWVAANRETVRGYARAFYRRNAATIKATKVRTPAAVRAAQSRAWKKANPEKVSASMRKMRYGITDTQYKKLLLIQGGLCAVCRLNPAEYVDHCHLTNKVRGVLCKKCNWGIGNFSDCSRKLRRAATYLERSYVR